MGEIVAFLISVMIILILAIIGLLLPAQKQGEGRSAATAPQDKIALALASLSGFNPAIVHRPIGANYGLAMDPDSDQFAIIIPGHQPRLYHFSQLIAVEVEKDSQTITTSNGKVSMKGTAVATALLGPIGLLMGAKTSSTSKSITNISSLDLKIYVNDLHSPCFTVNFTPCGWADEEAIKNIDAWYGRFRTIISALECADVPKASELAIKHAEPAPMPVLESWSSRVFGP